MSEPENEFEAMRSTGEEHERMKPFVGTFRAKVSIWMGPGEPVTSTGTMVNEWDLDGLFLKQTYTGDPNDGPFPSFQGRGYWGYNTIAGRYEGVWVDNASTMMQTETGEVDGSGRVWTMVGEMPNPSDPSRSMTKRTVIALEDDDRHRMTMYFDTGEGENKSMEIEYVRE